MGSVCVLVLGRAGGGLWGGWACSIHLYVESPVCGEEIVGQPGQRGGVGLLVELFQAYLGGRDGEGYGGRAWVDSAGGSAQA
jgi:hypothetical protein